MVDPKESLLHGIGGIKDGIHDGGSFSIESLDMERSAESDVDSDPRSN